MTDATSEPGAEPEAAANDLTVAAISPFPALIVGKNSVAFDHLAAFDFTFDTPIRKSVRCVVQFTTHCFSDKYDATRHAQNVVVPDERGVLRCFDQDRYDLSKGLEALIRSLPGKKVHQTPESNFAIITMQDGREYRVYFNIRRLRKKELRIYVESAYAPDTESFNVLPATSYQPVRFVILADKVLSNEPLVFKGR